MDLETVPAAPPVQHRLHRRVAATVTAMEMAMAVASQKPSLSLSPLAQVALSPPAPALPTLALQQSATPKPTSAKHLPRLAVLAQRQDKAFTTPRQARDQTQGLHFQVVQASSLAPVHRSPGQVLLFLAPGSPSRHQVASPFTRSLALVRSVAVAAAHLILLAPASQSSRQVA